LIFGVIQLFRASKHVRAHTAFGSNRLINLIISVLLCYWAN